MLERLFELAFKYRPVVFEQGELAFSPPWPLSVVLLAGLARGGRGGLGVPRRARRRRPPGHLAAPRGRLRLAVLPRPRSACRARAGAQGDRAAAEPPRRRDGRLAEHVARRRRRYAARRVHRRGVRPGAPLRQALADRFALRFFRFSSAMDRASGPEGLTFSGTRSHIGQALAQVVRRTGRVAGIRHRARERRRRHLSRADGRPAAIAPRGRSAGLHHRPRERDARARRADRTRRTAARACSPGRRSWSTCWWATRATPARRSR